MELILTENCYITTKLRHGGEREFFFQHDDLQQEQHELSPAASTRQTSYGLR